MKYGKSGIWNKIISSPFTLVIVVILFIFLLRVVLDMREKLQLSNSRLQSSNTELAELQTHQNNLSQKIDYLSTEQGIEAELRTKYRAIREGESIAVILDQEQGSSSVQIASSSIDMDNAKTSWWGRILDIVGF